MRVVTRLRILGKPFRRAGISFIPVDRTSGGHEIGLDIVAKLPTPLGIPGVGSEIPRRCQRINVVNIDLMCTYRVTRVRVGDLAQ